MLALVIFVSTFLGVGQEAKAAATTTAVTWGIVEVLEAIFATFGIAILTDSMLNTTGWTDGSSALDDDWQDIYDSMEEEYENQRIYLYGGGGGNEPESGDDNNNDEKPPHFDEIINTALSKKSLELSKEAYNCMNGWIDKYIQKSYELGEIICDKTFPDGINVDMNTVCSYSSVAYIFKVKQLGYYTDSNYDFSSSGKVFNDGDYHDFSMLVNSTLPICIYNDGSYNWLVYVDYATRFFVSLGGDYIGYNVDYAERYDQYYSYFRNDISALNRIAYSGKTANYASVCRVRINHDFKLLKSIPTFTNSQEACDYLEPYIYDNPTTNETLENKKIALSKLQKESYDKTGKIEYPNAPTFSPNLPSLDTLQELAKQLNNAAVDADARAKLIEDYIENLKPSVTIDPAPNPEPSPSPDPDPLPDPDAPSNPDTGDSDNPDDYTADLTQIFPFCIPFDLIHAFNVLNVPGEAPVFDIPFKLDYGSVHIDEHWTIDFSDFETVVQIFRVMETLGFIVGLILVTRALIKG